jgi:hypothetical protein
MHLSSNRILTAVAAVAALLAVAGPASASASASTIKGTVVHRNARAHSFVVAALGGRLSAVHARRSPVVGRVVRVAARRLRNGTFAAGLVRASGRRSHARIRGTVSHVDPSSRAFVVSARGASIRVRRAPSTRAASAAADSMPQVGTVVEVDTTIDAGGDLEADDVNEVGEDGDGIELEGVVLAVDAAAKTVTVSADDDDASGQSVVVHVADAADLTDFTAGQVVDLTVTATPGGFVLQRFSHDDDADEADGKDGKDGQHGDSGKHGGSDQHGDLGKHGGSDQHGESGGHDDHGGSDD